MDAIILGSWFEPSDHIEELVSVSTGRVRDREHAAYRLRVQQAYYTLVDG